jgi:hypothetical protein
VEGKLKINTRFDKCFRKTRYPKLSTAKDRASIARKYSGHDNIRAYKCPICGGYHIGHIRRVR